ncbi:MAG: rRNA maturation RNase YbeY [Nitrospirota bacterium]|nr:rRNA maturation RNase YbeY [Nitrospirota bacterium]
MRRVRKDLATALALLGREEAELSILFVGSCRMKTLNSQYRGIPKETDVLSFPMENVQSFLPDSSRLTPHSSRSLVLGDIVISIPKTIEQARAYSAPFYEELLRLLIHGLLHLLGYDHEKSRYQKVRMESKEKEILHAVTRLA